MTMLHQWWQGKPYENDRDSALFFMNRHQRHWTSRAAHATSDYLAEHHRWIIGLLFGLLVAVLVKR